MSGVLQKTSDVVTTRELIEDVFGGDDDALPDRDAIPVCAGEWRREPDGRWRFWQHPDW